MCDALGLWFGNWCVVCLC